MFIEQFIAWFGPAGPVVELFVIYCFAKEVYDQLKSKVFCNKK